MDYETQILQELVEAVSGSGATLEQLVEAVSRPDWWSVIATFVAAAVAAVITYVLGKRQNELQKQQLKIQERQNELQAQQVKLQEQQNRQQEQQTKLQEHQNELQEQQNKLQEVQTALMEQQTRAQEYNVYRGLYNIISSLHLATAGFITKVYSSIVAKDDIRIYTWSGIRGGVSTLRNDLDNKTIDIELKFPEELHRCESYKLILALMDGAISRIEDIEAHGLINKTKTADALTIVENIKGGDKHMIQLIKSCILDGEQREEFIKTLLAILLLYEEVCDSAFLEKIKSKI